MINKKALKRYCSEDISLIENYEKAINDKTQTWHCHHHLEIELSCSFNKLKELGLYYHRPASELIFLTKAEHSKLHKIGKWAGENNPMYGKGYKIAGENNPMYGKSTFDFMDDEKITKWRENISNSMKGKNGKTGEKANCYGRCWMSNGIDKVYPKKEDAEKYIDLGYHFGRK